MNPWGGPRDTYTGKVGEGARLFNGAGPECPEFPASCGGTEVQYGGTVLQSAV